MTYDHWKTTNPEDEWLGKEPPPCELSYAGRMHLHPRFPSGHCVVCGAEAHQGCMLEQSQDDDQQYQEWAEGRHG